MRSLVRTASVGLLALVCGCGVSKTSPAQPSAAKDNPPPVQETASESVPTTPAAAPTKTATTTSISPKRDRASAAAEAISESNKAAGSQRDSSEGLSRGG